MSDSLAPGLLVAVPQLIDPNFKQAVVLLLESGAEGAFGVVVNHESPLLLADLCRDHDIDYRGEPGKRVRRGGPVQPEQGLVVYDASIEVEDPESRPVLNGLHVSASQTTLGRLCGGAGHRFHCYAGYAGWAPGQLEREIREGSWILAPIDATMLLDGDPCEMWNDAMHSVGIDPALLVPGGTEQA